MRDTHEGLMVGEKLITIFSSDFRKTYLYVFNDKTQMWDRMRAENEEKIIGYLKQLIGVGRT